MQFGRRSHIDPETIDSAVGRERRRLVALLRELADKIEDAPLQRVSGGLAWVATAAEALVGAVERAVSGSK